MVILKYAMSKVIKTAVSLPSETFRRAEALRRKASQSRSQFYATALDAFFKALEVRELESRYEAGYRAKPEAKGDIDWAVRAGLSVLEPEDW
jgi:hypothetical protein